MSFNQSYIVAMIAFSITYFVLPSISAYDCENFTDCQSLLKFKDGITSDPDGHLEAWNNTSFFCNWTGIACHQHLQNRVISLELINMRLAGRITPFVSNLSLLTTLSLQDNSFFGEIPTTLGGLSELSYINISLNNLSGSIPNELSQIKNLTILSLAKNNLTGVIPSSLSNLTALVKLELAVNYFTGKIPPELGALTQLERLNLHTNYFEGTIPASISNCTALRELVMLENNLSGEIPSELGAKLHNLQTLYLWGNQLSGQIPVTLSNLSQLTLLDLSTNKLTGGIPLELGKLKKLEILYLHTNDLVSGSDNSSLKFLTALTNCSLLQKLHLGSCLFAGSLPASIGGLSKNLYYFNLLNNKITGEIPDSLGNLSSLVTLYLWNNYLNGTIPATLGNLGQLQRLKLGRNKLHGPTPDDMGHMTNLGLLDLSDNLLSGSIPPSLGNLSELRYLYLSQNSLSGNIPTQLSQCSLLMLLDLSFNNLQGSLPIEIGLLSNLALSLNLSNNNFEGELPASIGKLASVEAMDLSDNNFSGVIPSLIGSCISLAYLNLSHNMLEGIIPESLEQITYLEVLDFASNKLTGNVPIWIGNYQMIKFLNLSYNRLTGEVPNTGRFKNLGTSSFMGNAALCGGAKLMGLPPCEVQKQKQTTNNWFYYAIAISVGCILLFVLVAVIVHCFFFFNTARSRSTMASLKHHGSRTFTLRELEIATGGFDEANLLGRGSFGSVYKGTIDDGNTVVAVKVLHEEWSQNYRSLKRECLILSEIRHRNLVRLMGSAWNSKFKAIVLEFVGNGNLERHLYPSQSEEGGCQLTLKEGISIAIDVAHGLQYLHEECSVQVVHCDLKPQNVLLDNDMVAHVADFGIGKIISDDKPEGYVSTTGFLQGSVGYIPPGSQMTKHHSLGTKGPKFKSYASQGTNLRPNLGRSSMGYPQAHTWPTKRKEYGQGIKVSAKGDVYSFGVMMLEMITRKKPTSEMFSDGLDLRKWVVSAFPNRVLDVIDVSLQHEASQGGAAGALHKLEDCCIHLLDAGMMCTEENPQQRPPISAVVRRLTDVFKEMEFQTLEYIEK